MQVDQYRGGVFGGKAEISTFIELPPGLVELGFMMEEEYNETCIELQGSMYGNVDAALSYFTKFKEYALDINGLNLRQSKADPCLFYEKTDDEVLIGVIVVYVDDCILAGEKDFITRMKIKLKEEFGVVEDGQLRKLLGVRYEWKDVEDECNARVVLSMNDKGEEIVRNYEKATGRQCMAKCSTFGQIFVAGSNGTQAKSFQTSNFFTLF